MATVLFRPSFRLRFPKTPWQVQASKVFTTRGFQVASILAIKHMPPRPTLEDAEITGSYLKGSGPGGQKINKTSSAVQLIHKPTGIVVKSQATRSRTQNQKIARQILAEKVELLEKGEQSRIAVKTEAAAKKKASKTKKSQRKYRALEEAKKEGQSSPSSEEPAG